ncbi:MAG: hypothetical protein BalsKO_22210 [Balneolaceae bacterium]
MRNHNLFNTKTEAVLTPEEYTFIKEILGAEKKFFYYYKDKYALEVAKLLCNDTLKISELKKSDFSFLLQKHPLKVILSDLGRDTLTKDDLERFINPDGKHFHYTISEWGEYKRHRNDDWFQTSRPGKNLVLQLNFDADHNREYHRLVKPDKEDHPFVYGGHPTKCKRSYTLAWARLDISLETGEVLIEEIQNDWLREVRYWVKRAQQSVEEKEDTSTHWFLGRTSYNALKEYVEDVITSYAKLWDEAALCLAIQFCKQELGIERIYYHTFEGGNYLKGLEYSQPPRSLYTKLPRRFGFTETEEAPRLLKEERYLRKKLRKRKLKWFQLLV